MMHARLQHNVLFGTMAQLNLSLRLQRTYVKIPLQHEYFRFLDRHIYFIVTATPSDINIIAIENVNPGNIGKL